MVKCALKGLNVTLNVPNTVTVLLSVWVVSAELVEISVTGICRANVTNWTTKKKGKHGIAYRDQNSKMPI